MKLNSIFRPAKQWLSDTPQRALEQAYQAALAIRAIEDTHFKGQKVSAESVSYSDSVISYFKTEVKKSLGIIKTRLAEFKISRSLSMSLELSTNRGSDTYRVRPEITPTLDKLALIDEVVARYTQPSQTPAYAEPLITPTSSAIDSLPAAANNGSVEKKDQLLVAKHRNKTSSSYLNNKNREAENETISGKTSVLPRSFLRTFNRIKQEIDPNSEETEEKVLSRFRKSRNKTAISIKFFLILIIVPLLTHQITKTFLVAPAVEAYFNRHPQFVFINQELEEEALVELQRFEEKLHFESLIGLIPELSPEKVEEEVQRKAGEIAGDFRYRGADAVENIFADIFSLIAFAVIIFLSQREIAVVKSFIDEIVYGLSDSAKAFLIILVTDMFVGYHSPHGWEVILEGIARHFGLPENRDFNFLFIATFPVILDTILKYWIFRYLNRISPSSVATYRNMNE